MKVRHCPRNCNPVSFETRDTRKSRHWDHNDFENLAEGEAMTMTFTHVSLQKVGALSLRWMTSRRRCFAGLVCVLFSGFFLDAHAETFPVKVADDRGMIHTFPSPPADIENLEAGNESPTL